MKVELLRSVIGEDVPRQFCSTFLINESVAIDAGSLGLQFPLERQRQVKHVFLSHSHLDHVATLPLFLENVFEPGPACPTIYGEQVTLDTLQRNLFNNQIWPDFVGLSDDQTAFVRFGTLKDEHSILVDEISLTPVRVDHVLPTFAFIIEHADCAIAIVSDTGPTERIWSLLREQPHLRAVFLEASFPDRCQSLAEQTGHLCSSTFLKEVKKLDSSIPVIAVHLKAGMHGEIEQEIMAHGSGREIEIVEPGRAYEFD